MLEAVGWEKGTLERSIGEETVDELESSRSAVLVPFCVCRSQHLCQRGDDMGSDRRRQGQILTQYPRLVLTFFLAYRCQGHDATP